MSIKDPLERVGVIGQSHQVRKENMVRNLVCCGMFATLIAVGAFLRVPVPVVPFTLQFLFTMMAGLLLGGKLGALSVGVYILLGLVGLPVFTEGGGIWYVLKPSFGYLIGFCMASYVTGKMAEQAKKLSIKSLLVANFVGLVIVYTMGMVYYFFICNYVIHTPIGLWPLFLYCFILAIPGDICLCVLAAILGKKLIPVLRKGTNV